jgi:hypothetical protein
VEVESHSDDDTAVWSAAAEKSPPSTAKLEWSKGSKAALFQDQGCLLAQFGVV